MRLSIFFIIFLLFLMSLILLGLPIEGKSWFAILAQSDAQSKTLFYEFRFPELCMTLVAGACLSVAGLLLQTVLNNPLAGPSILGLTAGSHLFIAFSIFGVSLFGFEISKLGTTFAASLGAFFIGILILLLSLRFRSTTLILLVGVMISGFISAITDVLLTYGEPLNIRAFTMWSMGNLNTLSFDQIPLLVVLAGILLFTSFFLSKPLDALQLGESHARALGINVRKSQFLVFILVSLLAGLITAYAGPISFIGLIIPNLVRLFLKTGNHRHLIFACIVSGMCLLLFCNLLTHLFDSFLVVPINAICSFLGAPIVVFLLIKNKVNA